MKELTKSLTSFSWAMSLFGAKQLLNMMDPAKATRAFQSVADATETQLDESLRSAFHTGDRMQRSMVDAAFGLMNVGNAMDPTAWTEAARRAVGSISGAAGGGGAGAGQAGSAAGSWRPKSG